MINKIIEGVSLIEELAAKEVDLKGMAISKLYLLKKHYIVLGDVEGTKKIDKIISDLRK